MLTPIKRFQFVALQLSALQNCSTKAKVREALNSLPTGLDETYSRILMSLDQYQGKQALRALKWLIFSERPLELAELAEAVAIDPDNKLVYPQDVLEFLPSLVIIYEEGSFGRKFVRPLVRLAHFSVQEYLTSDRIKDGPAIGFTIGKDSSHIHIAESSLSYHIYASSRHNLTFQHGTFRELFPLWPYAAEY